MIPGLTEAERRVLVAVAAGLSTQAIASRLFVSRQAVAYHIGNLLRKFQVGNRAGLVSRAFVDGVLTTDRWPPEIAEERHPRSVVSTDGSSGAPSPRLSTRGNGSNRPSAVLRAAGIHTEKGSGIMTSKVAST